MSVTGIAKVLVKPIILQYLFNIPSTFPQQLKVKLNYELNIPAYFRGKSGYFVQEQINFILSTPFRQSYYNCSHKKTCKCNNCKCDFNV